MADDDIDVSGTEPVDAGAPDVDAAESGATQDTTPPVPQAAKPREEQFIDPSQLPEELKPHWKRMHGTYNKKLESINARKADIDLIDRFRSDPTFARQVLQQEAQRLGFNLGAPQVQAQPGTAQPGSAPAQLVHAIRSKLSPELQWMAESLAESQWAAHQALTAPIAEREQARERSTRQGQYEELAAKLTETAPGWEQHEDDMLDLLNFLQSPQMTHRRWGDKLSLLFNMATGNAAATAAAARQMGQAARQATRTGQPGRSTTSNLSERVLKAANNRAAIEIAAEAAMQELERSGMKLPD